MEVVVVVHNIKVGALVCIRSQNITSFLSVFHCIRLVWSDPTAQSEVIISKEVCYVREI